MDNIIQFVTVMFMLSMICERVAEFFKNYLSCKKILKWYWIGDTITKYGPDSPEELRRQYRILKLNLFFGWVTAILCHANIFDILRNIKNPGTVIGWPAAFSLHFSLSLWFHYLAFFLGCFFTGAFISLGSKFWHDLLDILLEVKNTKKILNDQRMATQPTNTQADFATLPEAQQISQIEEAINSNWPKWNNTYPNLTGVGIANKIKADTSVPIKVIRFEVSKKQDMQNTSETIPATVDYGGYKIPTDVVESDKFNLQYAYPGDADQPRKCGASLSRKDSQATGTISLKVKRMENGQMKYYMLTSGHVAMYKELQNGITSIDIGDKVESPEVVSPGLDAKPGGLDLGNLVEARINERTDSALVLLNNQADLNESIFEVGDPGNKTRSVDATDVGKTQVKFCGCYSGLVEGITIRGVGLKKAGNYPPKVGSIILQELISIDKCSDEGDSGAIVMDTDNRIIGMIVGASSFTYLIPIQSIKAAHKQFIII